MSTAATYSRSSDGYPVGGYRYDVEDSRFLQSTSANMDAVLSSPIRAPREFDPRGLLPVHDERPLRDPASPLRVEDQGQMGSCAGQAGSSCVEFCYWLATQRMEQLSAKFLYVRAQREDGIRGDNGSTISGCCKVVTNIGVPLESLWPYPPRYTNQPPRPWAELEREAAAFRIKSHTWLKSAQEVMQYLRSGVGAVQIGIAWGGEPDRNGWFNWRPGRGGHSVVLVGYGEEGREPFAWMLNSWGERWGLRGWAKVRISMIDQWFRHQHTAIVGYSDMANPDIDDGRSRFIDLRAGGTWIPGLRKQREAQR